MMILNEKEKHVILHSLGLTRSKSSYRNFFATGEGSKDYPICEKLVEYGLMSKRNDPFSKGMFVYHCTQECEEMAKNFDI